MKIRLPHNKIILAIVIALIFVPVIPSFGGTMNYVYDNLDRLIRAENTSNGSVVQFQYDAVGNRTQKTASVGPVNPTTVL
jgi:YD repeat-containing protein